LFHFVVSLFFLQIVSGSIGGDVRLYDMKMNSAVKTIQCHSKGAMQAMAVHDFAPLIATGSQKQKIMVRE
jgi:regulator-associated protein of mTOR